MPYQIIINIRNVKIGRTDYWLLFEAYSGYYNVHTKYKIEFCGTEFNSSIPLLDEDEELIRKMLVEDFGYGPYDLKKVKLILGTGKDYVIDH